jgi:Peptidase family M48
VTAATKPARARDLAAPRPVAVEPARTAKVGDSVGGRGLGRAVAIAGVPAVVLLVIVVAIGAALGSPVVAAIVGVVVAAGVWLGIWYGAKPLILRRLGGGLADESDVPRAANLVDGLCGTMGLPLPELVLLDDPFRGALVLGRNEQTATLVLTTGLLRALDPVELEGVLAHELSHVKSGDLLAATIAAAVVLPFAPLWSGSPEFVRRLAGPGRELAADGRAASVTRYPPGLRDGLVKMTAGPPPASPSTLASAGTGRVLRWLWTVVPDLLSPPSVVGVLDAPATRVAALDEA